MAARLSLGEREEIAVGLARGESMAGIGRRLGRQPSTVSREVRRNSLHAHAVVYGRPEMAYRAVRAERVSAARRPRRRAGCLARPGPLREVVLARLAERHSPRQIAVRLRADFPNRPEMHVSHETIYQAIYLQARGNLRAELTRQVALRSGRATRQRRPAAGAAIRSQRPWLGLNISARPAEAIDRAVPGHWEGDLVIGRNGTSAVATLVERATRFLILVALPDSRVSAHVVSQLTTAMSRLPTILRRSLTWDQGAEMAQHATFTLATNCPVFFCDPHSPWQRGTNENTNGLLRQYYPKGHFDFRTINQHDLDTTAIQMNNRPRQTLNWRTPAEKLQKFLTSTDATTP
ncbi:IS30 family transposase [Micromonospora sp. WMMD1128]|uniref:IS30 family transposase n=1 Tax=Micromonospora sp. WMMD1128 TaxID=3015150 RepID=UPI00248ADB9F|nr:IS30 family transposase [Micromonospora sp. WMMD1128]WBB72109.1 IS30 family transposase [Micromonospora sp. WMMD1128]WBB74359.1 IS30 family transposase [Micromonospora sp. WMMD1128]